LDFRLVHYPDQYGIEHLYSSLTFFILAYLLKISNSQTGILIHFQHVATVLDVIIQIPEKHPLNITESELCLSKQRIMKIKKLFLFVLGFAAVFGMLSFNHGIAESSKFSNLDSVKFKQTAKEAMLAGTFPAGAKGVTFDRPVSWHYVKPCLEAFKKYGVMPSVKLTQSVGFGRADLTKWLEKLPDKTECTDVRVCFGLYTKEFLDHYQIPNKDSLVNRLTVFLVPYYNDDLAVYKKGKGKHDGEADSVVVDSFNLGNVRP
jgi:hypothetical protein